MAKKKTVAQKAARTKKREKSVFTKVGKGVIAGARVGGALAGGTVAGAKKIKKVAKAAKLTKPISKKRSHNTTKRRKK